GAEFTKIFAIRYGGGIVPSSQAITLAEFYNHHAEGSLNPPGYRLIPSDSPEEGEESTEDTPLTE
ncbi:MAG: hypothetical protein ACK2U0_11200, partial [Candidatus Promineifilaceae bacterium]